ncbi:MAG: phage holin, partial [Acutalibacteraceae bacterium]
PPSSGGGQKLKIGGIHMLKNINWKVRLKNPTFWIQLVIALVSPILVGLGVQWQDMTTWAALWDALCNAVSNPVIVVSVIGSVWACITDPTTKGTADSRLALSYTTPKEDRPAD